MSNVYLESPLPPWVVLSAQDASKLNEMAGLIEHGGGLVRRVEGDRILSPSGVFSEFAEAFSFPNDFGRNWDALEECLGDIYSWLSNEVVVVVIHRADSLLTADHLSMLVDVLCDSAAWAASLVDDDGEEIGRPAVSLHFVFSVNRSIMREMALRLRRGGRAVSIEDDVVNVT